MWFLGHQPTFKSPCRCVSSFLGLNTWEVEDRLLKVWRKLGQCYGEILSEQQKERQEKKRDRGDSRVGWGSGSASQRRGRNRRRREGRGGEGKQTRRKNLELALAVSNPPFPSPSFGSCLSSAVRATFMFVCSCRPSNFLFPPQFSLRVCYIFSCGN